MTTKHDITCPLLQYIEVKDVIGQKLNSPYSLSFKAKTDCQQVLMLTFQYQMSTQKKNLIVEIFTLVFCSF